MSNKPLTDTQQEMLRVFVRRIDEFEKAVLQNAFKGALPQEEWPAIEARHEKYKYSLVRIVAAYVETCNHE